MAEPLATPFVMHGARDAGAGGLTHVEQQVKSIEQAALAWPESAGWSVRRGLEIPSGESRADRIIGTGF